MTCQHIHTHQELRADHIERNCLHCQVSWREWPIRMTDQEYDSVLLMLAAYHLGRPQPDDRGPA